MKNETITIVMTTKQRKRLLEILDGRIDEEGAIMDGQYDDEELRRSEARLRILDDLKEALLA